MDVSPFNSRALLSAFGIGLLVFSALTLLTACGDRYDLATERGVQARIDDANFFLSTGNCGAALEAINPVYNSPQVNDEVRLVKASAHACLGSFNMLNFVANLAGAPNFLSALAKSMSNGVGDGARSSMYQAVDILTYNSTRLLAANRTTEFNTYMVFIQMGAVGAILRNYGNPGTDGSQGTNLIYDTTGSPAGEMSNEDACALAAGLGIISDSYPRSSLNDADTASFVNTINGLCVSAGFTSCAALSKSRASCDGTNADSVNAQAVVNGINTAW